jgi:hypothetical protein
MNWARILAYATGTVDQELLLRNEYLAAENRILKAQLKGWGVATNAYSTRGPTRQPISQKSVSSRVASLKIAISSASRAGVA